MNENESILIHLDDEHEPEETIREVLRLVEEGYTSGINPNWEITEDEDTEEEAENTGPMKAINELIELGIEHCPECNCTVDDDWEYKDFSNKTITTCPQCGEDIFLNDFESGDE